MTVSALAAEWIEILQNASYYRKAAVSALAAEWIEMSNLLKTVSRIKVSALAAEWIEISRKPYRKWSARSPPSRRSGLKSP